MFDRYGGSEVLDVREVEAPSLDAGRVLVRVVAAATNPGEIAIREGRLADRWPATFPSGQGTDLAGSVEAVGEGVTDFSAGGAVLGWTEERASHAAYVVVPTDQLTDKPTALSWEVAGSMFVAPMAAYACVEAVSPRTGETVVVSGAAGGVGSVTVQLARRTGATVIGLASENNHDWLRAHDVVPVTYGDGQADRIRAATEGSVERSSTPSAVATLPWRSNLAYRPIGSIRSSISMPCSVSASKVTVATRSRAPKCWPSLRGWSPMAAWRSRSLAPIRWSGYARHTTS